MLTGNSLNSTARRRSTISQLFEEDCAPEFPNFRVIDFWAVDNSQISALFPGHGLLGTCPPPLRTRGSRLAIALRRWIGHNIPGSMSKIFRVVIWLGIAALGAFALATIALRRGGHINCMLLVGGGFCYYNRGYFVLRQVIAAKRLGVGWLLAAPASRP